MSSSRPSICSPPPLLIAPGDLPSYREVRVHIVRVVLLVLVDPVPFLQVRQVFPPGVSRPDRQREIAETVLNFLVDFFLFLGQIEFLRIVRPDVFDYHYALISP